MIAWRWVGSGAPPNMVVPLAKVCGAARNAFRFASLQTWPVLALRASEYWKLARLAILRPTTPLSEGALSLLASRVWQSAQLALNRSWPVAAMLGPPARAEMKAMRGRVGRTVTSPNSTRQRYPARARASIHPAPPRRVACFHVGVKRLN